MLVHTSQRVYSPYGDSWCTFFHIRAASKLAAFQEGMRAYFRPNYHNGPGTAYEHRPLYAGFDHNRKAYLFKQHGGLDI